MENSNTKNKDKTIETTQINQSTNKKNDSDNVDMLL